MIAEQTDDASDRLLEVTGYINKLRGKRKCADCYTEEQLQNHRRREYSNNEAIISLYRTAESELADMVNRELEEIYKLSGLPEHHLSIWHRYMIEDKTPSAIAKELKDTEEHVILLIGETRGHLRRTMLWYPFLFLWQIYWGEVNRRG